MKKEILHGLRIPGWEEATEATRQALIDELDALPEDQRERETAPACARVTDVQEALERVRERPGVTESDRALLASWQTIGHAGSIAVFLDLATLAAGGNALSLAMASADCDLIGRECYDCHEPIAVGDQYERVPSMSGDWNAAHRECLALSMIGHFWGLCTCTRYGGLPTRRAAAKELMRRLDESQRQRREKMS